MPYPRSVAVALGQLGDRRAIEPLLARLDATGFGIAAAIALTQLMGEESLTRVAPLPLGSDGRHVFPRLER